MSTQALTMVAARPAIDASVTHGNLAAVFARVRARIVIVDEPEPPAHEPPCTICKGSVVRRQIDDRYHPDLGRAIPCDACGVIARRRHERLLGSLPEHFRDVRLDTYPVAATGQRRLIAHLRAWLESDRWLYLHSPPGRGKTGLAAALGQELANHSASVAFAVVPDLLGRIRQAYRSRDSFDGDEQNMLEALYGVDVLILDDLGTEKGSDWVSEKIFQVIGHRYAHHKRTIITSNLDLLGLGDHLGDDRVSSRIGELADVIDLSALPNLRVRPAANVIPLPSAHRQFVEANA